jgi:probable addiction module antidote protein
MKKYPPAVSYHEYLIKSLRDPKECVAYLNAALEENNRKVFLSALRNVLEAQGGMTKIARAAKLNRVSLYKMLHARGNPGFENIMLLLNTVGIRFYAAPAKKPRAKAA